MKLHVYQQEKSNITWVRDDEFTPEEQAGARLQKVGEVDSADYRHVGMGYYRHIKEG